MEPLVDNMDVPSDRIYLSDEVVYYTGDHQFYHLCWGKERYGKRVYPGDTKCTFCGKKIKEPILLIMKLVGK